MVNVINPVNLQDKPTTMNITLLRRKKIALALFLFILSFSAHTQTIYEKIFWPDFASANTIKSINLNGSNEITIVPSLEAGEPTMLDVDPIGQKIYWYDQVSDNIKRANVDGSSVEDFVTAASMPIGMCIDLHTNSLYWADFVAIRAINLDGTNRRTIVSGTGVGEPISVQVDGLAGDVYWVDQVSRRIQRAKLNGTNIQTVATPTGIAFIDLDVTNHVIYWSDLDVIEKVNTDGTGRTVVVTHANAGEPICVTIDLPGSKIYWADQVSLELRRANLDGTNTETFLSIGSLPLGLSIPTNPGALLPLSLLSFTAAATNDGVTLQWVTTDEVNTEAFDIERSSDGRHFTSVGSMPTKASSSSHTYTYVFNDRTVSADTYFYRLKMRDVGGAFTYSKTVTVHYASQRAPSFVVFPNPATSGDVYLRPLRRINGSVMIRVVTLTGAIVLERMENLSGSDHPVRLGSFSKGNYVVQIKSADGVMVDQLRFVR